LDAATHQPLTFLKGINVEEKIRTIEVSSKVSPVSTLEFVRKAMVAQQRKWGEEKGIIMDGRDIGTTVFPHAELKIFVTASPEIRAKRRYDELIAKGVKAEWEDILKNVKERDYIDQNRQISPLRKATDAILLDNSQMTLAEQSAWLWEQYRKVIQAGKNDEGKNR
jgi:cytidylate kinase